MQILNKKCPKCEKTKPISEYYIFNKEKNNISAYCKECSKRIKTDWRNKNIEKAREYRKIYYQKNAEKERNTRKAYYAQNKSKELEENKRYKRTLLGRYNQLKSAAKKRKSECISFEEYKNLLKDDMCYYCGKSLNETGYALDRVDSSKGYTLGNVRTCCSKCNSAKNNMAELEFYSHIEAVYKNYLKRK
jgi:hypothetical protein